MNTSAKTSITVEALVKAPVAHVWAIWTQPQHITQWNQASPDWHTPRATNDVRVGGKFTSRMEAKDGSMGFDFEGEYTDVKVNERLSYCMSDGRTVDIVFTPKGEHTHVSERFDAETMNSVELQRQGWQAILDSFVRHAEKQLKMPRMHFSITIQASVEKVYQTMLGEKTYPQWTAAFNPTSNIRGSWEKGSKILFIGTDKDGNEGGMVSRIKENSPNELVTIEHLGLYGGGHEITSGPEVEAWAGAIEQYTFIKQGNATELKVELDVNTEFESYFKDTWPKALQLLKSICEA
ncbi:SRPBCC family protein [Shiella aurantiaca]|uniref:SRPBCC family protein n=1 Tax=Shiella aurantiaca TaxID=3058365 RepID=UPI0029F51010|nr:SRPBCC family protein [Shiella aurantiaca]